MKPREIYRKYSGELKSLIIGVTTSIIGTIIVLVTIDINKVNPLLLFIFIFVILIASLLVIILFNLKRIIFNRLDRVHFILENQFGFSVDNNQYYERSKHFVKEKRFFGKLVVEEVLPNLIKNITEKKVVDELNLFLEVGGGLVGGGPATALSLKSLA